VVGVAKTTTLYTPAAFAELRLAPLPGLSVLPSVRLDWYSVIRRWTVDPRLVARQQIGPSTAANLRVLCKPHDLLAARLAYGDAWMSQFIRMNRPAPLAGPPPE